MYFAPGVVVPGHVSETNVPLTLTLVAAGLASMALVAAGILALVQRRSTSYLLVAAALVLLFARTVTAVLALNGVVTDGSHHLLEHGIDVAVTSLVFGAVYFARRGDGTTDRSDGVDDDAGYDDAGYDDAGYDDAGYDDAEERSVASDGGEDR